MGSLPTVPARHSRWEPEFAVTSGLVLPSHLIKTAVFSNEMKTRVSFIAMKTGIFLIEMKTGVSLIATIVSFFNSFSGLFTGIPTAILTITRIWIMDRITNIGTIRLRLCNRNPPDLPPIMARLL
jgi:hypothetical protein